jgi:hypothetical protein
VGNLIYGGLGNNGSFGTATSDRSMGAVLGNLWEGRLGTWAIHLREQTPQLGQGDAASPPAPGFVNPHDPNVHTSESFDIMWGKKFGTTSFGLRLNRSNTTAEGDLYNIGLGSLSKIETDDPFFDPNTARNIMGVGAGAAFELSPTSTAEFNVLWQNRDFKLTDSLGTVLGEDDGATAYQVAARAMWQWQPNVLVVPVFKWSTYDLSNKFGTPLVATESSVSQWQAGIAGNWTLGSNDLFVLGATFAQNKFDNFGNLVEVTETHFPQVFAALETHVNNMLTLRFGATKGVFSKIEVKDGEDTASPGTFEIRASDFEMRLGVGVKVGALQLDAVLNNNYPFNGPFLFTGNSTAGVFPHVTATYGF